MTAVGSSESEALTRNLALATVAFALAFAAWMLFVPLPGPS